MRGGMRFGADAAESLVGSAGAKAGGGTGIAPGLCRSVVLGKRGKPQETGGAGLFRNEVSSLNEQAEPGSCDIPHGNAVVM